MYFSMATYIKYEETVQIQYINVDIDYSNNKLVHYVQFVDKMIYLIAYDEYQDKVLPIYVKLYRI